MDRRAFLRRAAVVAAGAVAADQLELLERLTHRRRLFSGVSFGSTAYDQHARLWVLRDDHPVGNLIADGGYEAISLSPQIVFSVSQPGRLWRTVRLA